MGMLILFIGLMIDVNFKLVCIVIIWFVSMKVLSIIIDIKLIVMFISNCWIMIKNVFIFIKFFMGDGGIIGMMISVSIIFNKVFICGGMDLVFKLIMVINKLLMCINGSSIFVRNWLMVVSLIFIILVFYFIICGIILIILKVKFISCCIN